MVKKDGLSLKTELFYDFFIFLADLDIFEECLEKADAIDARMKKYVLENSKSVFEKLGKHPEKNENP